MPNAISYILLSIIMCVCSGCCVLQALVLNLPPPLHRRMWDIRTGSTAKTLALDALATSLELSRDGSTLTVAEGKRVTFVDATR